MPRKPYMRSTNEQRFWAKVDRRGPDECWPWLAYRDACGYGAVLYREQAESGLSSAVLRAHRVSFLINVGPIADGLRVCHSCDNPPCVNPAHLFLGTQADNVRDMVTKGRKFVMRGEGHPNAKITLADVAWIRWARGYAGVPYGRIGRAYGIGKAAARRAALGLHWADRREPPP